MKLFDKEYELVDTVKANIPDCFVFHTNQIGTAHGESKFYIGGTNTKNWIEFFDDKTDNSILIDQNIYKFNIDCFITKKDLMAYMDMAKGEYEEQNQHYLTDISSLWQGRRDIIDNLPDYNFFKIYHKEYKNKSRYYINSNDKIYLLLRKVALPVITSILVQKIKIDDKYMLWFRPYINEIGNVFENDVIEEFVEKEIEKINENPKITSTEKLQLTKARVGQGIFRDSIIEKYNSTCIITGINDERILIASHIKPWAVSNDHEKLSRENGLLLSPTFDKLFDKGFISFKNNGEIILSDYFSDRNFKILNLKNETIYNLKTSEEMKRNLEYHRENIFVK